MKRGCTAEGTVEVEAGESLDIVVAAGLDTCLAGVSTGSVNSFILDGPGEAATVLLGGLPADASDLSDTLSIWTWSGLTAGTYGWTATLGGPVIHPDRPCGIAQSAGLVRNGDPAVCSGDSGVVSGITTGGGPSLSVPCGREPPPLVKPSLAEVSTGPVAGRHLHLLVF